MTEKLEILKAQIREIQSFFLKHPNTGEKCKEKMKLISNAESHILTMRIEDFKPLMDIDNLLLIESEGKSYLVKDNKPLMFGDNPIRLLQIYLMHKRE